MYTTTKRNTETENIVTTARRGREFGAENDTPIRNFNYTTANDYNINKNTSDTGRGAERNQNADYAARILFDRGGTVTEDMASVGSQGPVVTPVERHYTLFNIDEMKTRNADYNGADSVFVPPYEARRAKNEFKYFTGDRVTVEREPEEIRRREPEETRKNAKAIKPSEETLIYRERRNESEKKFELSSKNKVVIAIFAAVVVFLIAMIITSGVTASKLSRDVNGLKDDISLSQAANTLLRDELVLIKNDAVLKDKAEQAGMIASDGTYIEVTLIPTVEPVEYLPRTNWFDRFCDWLSRVFGG